MRRSLLLVPLLALLACSRSSPAPAPVLSEPAASSDDRQAATITILTTNAADMVGKGEWSFAAWVETSEGALLFDTGWSPRNVLENAEALGIDLSVAENLVLSHHHGDHTGGLVTLRRELMKRNPKALSRIHVAEGIFTSRPGSGGSERNPMLAARAEIEATGAEFIIHEEPAEIAPGVWVTGPVPRVHDERTYPRGPERILEEAGEIRPDTVPESQSLLVVAEGGPILVSGCGHAGLINTLEYSRGRIVDEPVQSAIGGFHLFAADDEVLQWTAERASDAGLGGFLGSHCTGFESVYRIRDLAGLSRDSARVGAIGTRYVAGSGIVPGAINR